MAEVRCGTSAFTASTRPATDGAHEAAAMNEQQAELVCRIHEVWGKLQIPDWPRMEGDFEEAELSRWLSGLAYHEMFEAQWISESVWIWCRPDVSAYYLGGHLLRA